MTIQYYESFESKNLYAVTDGQRLLFKMYTDDRHSGPWHFIQPGTSAYDYHHQKLFRQHDGRLVEPSELPDDLTPLPSVPAGPFPSWAENQGQGRRFDATDYPATARRVRDRGDAGLPVHVVLWEDRYESMFGDGSYLYLEKVMLDQEGAEQYVVHNASDSMHARTLREFTLKLEGGALYSPDYAPGHFEHYRLEEVLRQLERQLGNGEDTGDTDDDEDWLRELEAEMAEAVRRQFGKTDA